MFYFIWAFLSVLNRVTQADIQRILCKAEEECALIVFVVLCKRTWAATVLTLIGLTVKSGCFISEVYAVTW